MAFHTPSRRSNALPLPRTRRRRPPICDRSRKGVGWRLTLGTGCLLCSCHLPARNPLPAAVLYRERQTLIQQLNNLLGPDDLVAVMTSDMRVAELTFERRLPLTTDAWPNQSADPRYALWDACYPAAFPGSPNGEMKARYQELMTFEALDALIAHLGGLRDERKHVLVLTNGFRLYHEERDAERARSTRYACRHSHDRRFDTSWRGSPARRLSPDR